jgi:hypothetical protein
VQKLLGRRGERGDGKRERGPDGWAGYNKTRNMRQLRINKLSLESLALGELERRRENVMERGRQSKQK